MHERSRSPGRQPNPNGLQLQADDGHWPGDYGGPMFLMPGMVIALYTCGVLDSVLRWGLGFGCSPEAWQGIALHSCGVLGSELRCG